MTREFRLMLAEQGADDAELMGACVSAAADPCDAEIARLRAALWEIMGSGGRHSARVARAALEQSWEARK